MHKAPIQRKKKKKNPPPPKKNHSSVQHGGGGGAGFSTVTLSGCLLSCVSLESSLDVFFCTCTYNRITYLDTLVSSICPSSFCWFKYAYSNSVFSFFVGTLSWYRKRFVFIIKRVNTSYESKMEFLASSNKRSHHRT